MTHFTKAGIQIKIPAPKPDTSFPFTSPTRKIPPIQIPEIKIAPPPPVKRKSPPSPVRRSL